MAKQKIVREEIVMTSTRSRMGVCHILCGLLNIFNMICSWACMGMGIWLATGHGSECLQNLKWPILGFGLFLFVFSLIGIFGAFLRNKILLSLYLAVALLIIVALVVFAVLSFIVTKEGSGEPANGRAYQEYHLSDYSKWLQHQLRNRNYWAKIQQCIEDGKVCQKLHYTNSEKYFSASLSPLQFGCCKPPATCNLTFVNATNWTAAKDTNIESNKDCKTWNNNPSELCYECDSCRAAVAETGHRAWTKMALACAVMVIYMIICASLCSCALMNTRDRYYETQKVMRAQPTYHDSVVYYTSDANSGRRVYPTRVVPAPPVCERGFYRRGTEPCCCHDV